MWIIILICCFIEEEHYQTYSIKNGEMIINCTAVYWLLIAAWCTLSKDKKHWIHRIQTSYILVIFFTKTQECGN